MPTKNPSREHDAFLNGLHQFHDQFTRIPPVEKMAVTAQFLGAIIAELPDDLSKDSVMKSAVQNILSGNENATRNKKPGIIAPN